MKAFTKSGYDGHGCKYKMYYLIWSDEFRKNIFKNIIWIKELVVNKRHIYFDKVMHKYNAAVMCVKCTHHLVCTQNLK